MIQEHVGPRPHSQEPGFLRTLWRTLEAPLGATSTSEGTTQNHRTVVPKIANPRNHQEADTDANTRGLIYTLELGSKYTRHSGAGTWTPSSVTHQEMHLYGFGKNRETLLPMVLLLREGFFPEILPLFQLTLKNCELFGRQMSRK
ncbi:uncharacterized protein LOC144292091 isoform X1 [Canis aureus]